MSIRDSMSDPRLVRDINCGILDGLRLRKGLPLGHVLLVESDPEIRALLGGTLRRAGYRVRAAANLDASLRHGHRERPDLILVDIVIPRGDGLGAIAALRAGFGAVRIAAYCGDDRFARHLDTATDLGADAVVDAPADPASLLQVVRDLLELPGGRHAARPRNTRRAAG